MKDRVNSLMLILVAAVAYQSILTPLEQLPTSRRLADHSKHSGVFLMNPGALVHERRLNEDLYDDAILFGTPGAKTGSIEEQSRADEMGGVAINFNRTYDDLRRRLETYRRYSAGDIPDDIRVAALNAYIENAIIMQNLGVLDEEEDQEDQFEDYYASSLSLSDNARKAKAVRSLQNNRRATRLNVRRNANGVNLRAARRNAQRSTLGNLQRHLKSADVRKLPDASARANFASPAPQAAKQSESLDRANSIEFGSENILQGESGGAFGSIFNGERRLRNVDPIRKSSRHSHRRLTKRQRNSPSQKLRQGDALLELARAGNLFDIDFNAVYDLTGEEVPNDLSRTRTARALRGGHNFKI